MENRAFYPERAPESADTLDSVSFYEQYNSITKRALDAIDGGDTQIVAGYINEMALLRLANPQLTRELETRWEAPDSDL